MRRQNVELSESSEKIQNLNFKFNLPGNKFGLIYENLDFNYQEISDG